MSQGIKERFGDSGPIDATEKDQASELFIFDYRCHERAEFIANHVASSAIKSSPGRFTQYLFAL